MPEEFRRFTDSKNKRKSLLDYPMSRPYILRMRIARREILEFARDNKWSMAKYVREVRRQYIKMGWVGKDGKPSVWAMFRHFYKKSVDVGDYIPPVKKKKRGDVKAQRQRYYDKQKTRRLTGRQAPSGDPRFWIAQLQDRLTTETNPDRVEQFEKQIRRLKALYGES